MVPILLFMRTCNICKQEKPLTEFHKNASRPLGRDYRCKDCFLAWDKERSQLPHRKNKAVKQYHNAYKDKARNAVAVAIKNGSLLALNCPKCGEKGEAHHYMGYEPEHWLDVLWLCRPHHMAKHRL